MVELNERELSPGKYVCTVDDDVIADKIFTIDNIVDPTADSTLYLNGTIMDDSLYSITDSTSTTEISLSDDLEYNLNDIIVFKYSIYRII